MRNERNQAPGFSMDDFLLKHFSDTDKAWNKLLHL